MAGIKSPALCVIVALCCFLTTGCREEASKPDASAAKLKETTRLLAEAERDRDSARMVLKAVRNEVDKLKTDLTTAQDAMRKALDRVKPLEDEVIQLRKELARFKPPEKGGPRPTTAPK